MRTTSGTGWSCWARRAWPSPASWSSAPGWPVTDDLRGAALGRPHVQRTRQPHEWVVRGSPGYLRRGGATVARSSELHASPLCTGWSADLDPSTATTDASRRLPDHLPFSPAGTALSGDLDVAEGAERLLDDRRVADDGRHETRRRKNPPGHGVHVLGCDRQQPVGVLAQPRDVQPVGRGEQRGSRRARPGSTSTARATRAGTARCRAPRPRSAAARHPAQLVPDLEQRGRGHLGRHVGLRAAGTPADAVLQRLRGL